MIGEFWIWPSYMVRWDVLVLRAYLMKTFRRIRSTENGSTDKGESLISICSRLEHVIRSFWLMYLYRVTSIALALMCVLLQRSAQGVVRTKGALTWLMTKFCPEGNRATLKFASVPARAGSYGASLRSALNAVHGNKPAKRLIASTIKICVNTAAWR